MRIGDQIRKSASRAQVLAMARDCCDRLAKTAVEQRQAPKAEAFRFQAETDERGLTAEMRERLAKQSSFPFDLTRG